MEVGVFAPGQSITYHPDPGHFSMLACHFQIARWLASQTLTESLERSVPTVVCGIWYKFATLYTARA